MGRYYHPSSSFLSVVYFLFSVSPMVFSLLSQTQTETMNSLSKNLTGRIPWTGSDPCAWKGVSCDLAYSSVVGISLSGFSLNSSDFLPLVCKIETLEILDVSNNHLSSIHDGFITECGKIKGLKLLNFSYNILGVLPTFHGFDALESLDMSFNAMRGNIVLEIDVLVSLKILNLSFNVFSGSLPTKLGMSMVLEHLLLSNNSFEGKIPDELLSYENLTWIDLKNNILSHSIPTNIGKLSKLETLILSTNALTGEIPTSLANITKLSRFAANQNNFTGSIPSGITKYLTSLDLSYNGLSGAIPEDFLSPQQLQVVDLTNNMLNGSLPTKVSPNLFRLRFGSNQLSGNIPPDAFVQVQNLTYLELDDNMLMGSIPAELSSCKSLTLLNLAQNRLSGVFPQQLGNLTNLRVLKLQLNNLSGAIPTQIGQLNKLLTLNLSRNSLSGPIPPDIANLSSLNFLYLYGNNLNGSIPTSIGMLDDLLELQLGENHLRGVIPSMPLSLQVTLNLSSNYFSGSIPTSFGSLRSLEILDLSNNAFSGGIPDYLTGMLALTRLILSNNPLSGAIPNFSHHIDIEFSGTNLKNYTAQKNETANTGPRGAKNGIGVGVAILIAIVAAIFLVGFVTLLVLSVSRHYYRVNDEHSQSTEVRQHPQVMQSNLLTPNGIHRSNIDFSKAMEAVAETSNVTLKTRFSTYYKAVMPSGSIYYVKKLNWFDKVFQVGSHDKFVKELEVLAKLNNSNVMTPLAYVLSTDTAYILYEFISNGSLFDVLHGSMDLTLDWASRYSIAVGVAQGLSFLHGFASSPILLLDLSSKSIMLKSLKEPLVGDIEHYKVIDPSKSTGNFSAVAGSVGYIPPEYAYTMTVTMAGNVYSFGVILLELLTGKPAVTEGTELVKWVLRNSTNQDYILDFNISRTSQAVRNQMLAILEIARVCVGTSPESRPKMKSVLRMLLNAR
ncbi:LRR receptor-like serine/threonine-protein kinase GSO1 [Vigna umbellata]|uniref:LRR receptor-like serine/threonine-protein kinase GSO1 n=1 Tax=Vigna umbellata TaxID=87088 RepID=UPI001F5F75E0|nr:LRR receptor-like serine/threonine-protein kinase GSO1 [Vigna umbellata]XP_047155733.1 LRR receptor-like serine/threonine-protein kinase GSO1 [Vigna umbellata]